MTIKVKVRFFAGLTVLVGKDEVELEFKKPATIVDLLSLLVKRYGFGFKDYIYDKDGKVRSVLQFLVNGTSINVFEGFETKLRSGDVVAIIPVVGGG
jgi:MoaD family protein